MAKDKTPVRVNDDARPEQASEENGGESDLVEIVKRNGEFRKWGMFWGPVLYWLSIKATRPKSVWWRGLVAVAIGVAGLWIRYAT